MDSADESSHKKMTKTTRKKWTYHETQYFLEILKGYHCELRKNGCGKKWCLWDKIREQHQSKFPSSRVSMDYYYKYGNLMHAYRAELERKQLENDSIESCERNFPHFTAFHELLQETDHPLHTNGGSSILFVPSKEQKRISVRTTSDMMFQEPVDIHTGECSSSVVGHGHPQLEHPHISPVALNIPPPLVSQPQQSQPSSIPEQKTFQTYVGSESRKRPTEEVIFDLLKDISSKIDHALGPGSAFDQYYQLKAELARAKLMRHKDGSRIPSNPGE
eukprot:TRINITY_DN10781_c0_g1_i1.p1 TRINITY_DN10781_c0_g1~~TRINITY_DN10781_c0_g1_i1.p1  ORF type:complete len:275 (+),score=51.11 TRINITY_DN10781_c0_g1_i1:76-900(+)